MSDADDDIESIRERKKEELRASATTPDETIHVRSEEHLQQLLDDHRILLVDFHADWCGPCKMLAPTVETIAADTAAAVAKVDIDDHQGLARRYRVQGVPTLTLFVDGDSEEQLVGVQDEGTLRDLVERYA